MISWFANKQQERKAKERRKEEHTAFRVRNMKEQFEQAELEIIEIQENDVITASSCGGGAGGGNELEWV
jgi:hypothetical protein